MGRKHTIGNIAAGLLIALAVVFDGIQALLTVSVFLLPFSVFFTFLSTITFFICFALLGVSYSGRHGATRMLTMIAMTVAELAPVINAIPATTAGVAALILMTRFEDAKKTLSGPPQPSKNVLRQMRLQQTRQARAQIAHEEYLAANDNFQAANDNFEEESERRAA